MGLAGLPRAAWRRVITVAGGQEETLMPRKVNVMSPQPLLLLYRAISLEIVKVILGYHKRLFTPCRLSTTSQLFAAQRPAGSGMGGAKGPATACLLRRLQAA